jgi:hypothetical protein
LIPCQINFQDAGGQPISAHAQATCILDEVQRQYNAGITKVGITYSANQAQTEAIINNNGKWPARARGANQAAVMMKISELLETPNYASLKAVFHIIPITTMKYDGTTVCAADEASVTKSLANAVQFVTQPNSIILGWTNQNSYNSEGTLWGFAVGGGVASSMSKVDQAIAERQHIRIQTILRTLSSPTNIETLVSLFDCAQKCHEVIAAYSAGLNSIRLFFTGSAESKTMLAALRAFSTNNVLPTLKDALTQFLKKEAPSRLKNILVEQGLLVRAGTVVSLNPRFFTEQAQQPSAASSP